jgi:hypothetical protein
MPLSYAYKCRPDLFCENVRRRQSDSTCPITVCRVGQVAVAMVVDDDRKPRYRPASSTDALHLLRQDPKLEFRRATVSYAGVDVELVQPGLDVEPAAGDIVEIGISLTNSETGGRQLKASAYSHRLVCSNGAIINDNLGAARWPNDPRMTYAGCLRAFQRDFGSLIDKLAPVKELYRAAVDRPVPDDELWALWRRIHYLLRAGSDRGEARKVTTAADAALMLSEDERRELQKTVAEREPLEPPAMTGFGAYEIHNRVTHAAHGRRLLTRRGLQELGGDFLSRALSWPPAPSAN